jgi:predicted small secreted protein
VAKRKLDDIISSSFTRNIQLSRENEVKRLRLLLSLVAVSVLLTACASGPTRDINDPTNSLLFGYIDMEDAPTDADGGYIQQVAPPSEKPYWNLGGMDDGLFFHPFLPVGAYQLSSFYGSAFFRGNHEYHFPRQGNVTAIKVGKPGIYFLGSYKYTKVKTGFFEGAKFSIEKTDKPTEAELLTKILEDRDIKKSAWAEKIQARLKQLKT